MCQKSGSRVTALLNLLGQTEEVAEEVYDRIYDINEAGVDSEQCREAENILLKYSRWLRTNMFVSHGRCGCVSAGGGSE